MVENNSLSEQGGVMMHIHERFPFFGNNFDAFWDIREKKRKHVIFTRTFVYVRAKLTFVRFFSFFDFDPFPYMCTPT